MENQIPKHRSWLITALLTIIFFGGALATEWIASDLEPMIRNYKWIAYVIGGISLILTMVLAVRTTRESTNGGTSASSSRQISIGGSANNSTNITGDNNTVKSSRNR